MSLQSPIELDWAKSKSQFLKLCNEAGFESVKCDSISDLSGLALKQKLTRLVLECFDPIFLQIVCQWFEPTNKFEKSEILQTFSIIAPIYPQCLDLLEHFLIMNPGILDKEESISSLYRLLTCYRSRLLVYVSPTALYKILSSSDHSTRALAIICLALYIGASESLTENWLQQYCGSNQKDIAVKPLELAWERARPLRLLEHKGLFELEPSLLLANIGGLLIPKLNLMPSAGVSFIPTKIALRNVRNIGRSLLLNEPVLLKGKSGSGKTFYVESLAAQLRPDQDIIRIHLGEQTDSKALIGNYSTGETPGTFEWKQGVLTAAVTQGKWVLIEDLDKAPTDVISTLLPLLEKRQLLIPSRNETIVAKRGFQLFATLSLQSHTEVIGQRLWSVTEIEPPSTDDLIEIIGSKYPRVKPFAPQLVNLYSTLSAIFDRKGSTVRPISTRDLIRCATRIEKIISQYPVEELPISAYDDIFREAVHCFTGFSDNQDFTEKVAEIVADSLDIALSKVQPLLTHYVPALSETETAVSLGCASLEKRKVKGYSRRMFTEKTQNFATTSHGLRLLEQIALGVECAEPLLLVGETGTGKTTIIQYLANLVHRKLVVINISQQMEASDLIGGFKPLDAKMLAGNLLEEFNELFDVSFSRTKNQQFCDSLNKALKKDNWKVVIALWNQAYKMVEKQISTTSDGENASKKRKVDSANYKDWTEFHSKVKTYESRLKDLQKSMVFQFIEGLLVKAVRKGYWVLLDEINLAPPDTLEGLGDLLNTSPSLTIVEKGGDEVVKAHPDFRLFACMNPATDVGKKDLPESIRSRFTEQYVRSPDEDIDDLRFIIDKYIGRYKMNDVHIVNDVAQLYLAAKKLASDHALVDGAGQKPHFSIRTLSRTLSYAISISSIYGLRRALYEGFSMSFLTLLDKKSSSILEPYIFSSLFDRLGNIKSVLSTIPSRPKEGTYIQFEHYWIEQGQFPPTDDSRYIITPSVQQNLLNLVRATASMKFPVLIQGPTSAGKTSMIQYLAGKTGHEVVRINNHEHTDIQEYLGTYVTTSDGILEFQEGVLVEALRNGYWIILDELNLAPTDVLEALNRLLDDNRELLIPETQEVVKPHPNFMLFATQNPPGLYAGRKILSRAFRNRFLELHFDDIPQDELELILRDRCLIAPSYAKKIVDVYKNLALQRQSSRVFEQKNSFATLRDLFRWANREAVGYDQLAMNGYMLLCERVRNPEEKSVVKEAIEKVMRVKVDVDYDSMIPREFLNDKSVTWTKAMKRLAVLVSEAIKQKEPILLVGETGCGKTTIIQVLATAFNKKLHILNAHQNTETGDLIGSQRPLRNRSEVLAELDSHLEQLFPGKYNVREYYKLNREDIQRKMPGVDFTTIDALQLKSVALFEWTDGSLVQAMKHGEFFLLDEISLADDSVLERLNSVLESERTLLLPEKGSEDILVQANPEFQFFATMNPGGDYGKKELSPALRNRFTEIWVPSMENRSDVELIVSSKLSVDIKELAPKIVEFSEWFAHTYGNGNGNDGIVSLRDILNWVQFINSNETLDAPLRVFYGACMVFIDSIGSNFMSFSNEETLKENRLLSVNKISTLLGRDFAGEYFSIPQVINGSELVEFGKFTLRKQSTRSNQEPFSLSAPTTAKNAMRVVRAMTIGKPILLEGSPGVGKTSLVSAIAAITGHKLTRINLSDQTDLTDLFGSDTPSEGARAGDFTWRDAPFLRAMQAGEWVLLDEMNLAPQQVLEGLNSCLDHRGEAYIPELDRTFRCHAGFRVFAAQNPQSQGGGRKGLPKSFVNRFSVVYMDSLELTDLHTITDHLYHDIPEKTRFRLVEFINSLEKSVYSGAIGQVGHPFEFNLRDTMRWLQLCRTYELGPEDFFSIIVRSRFRTDSDREKATMLFEEYFGTYSRSIEFGINSGSVKAGHSFCSREAKVVSVQVGLHGHLQCNTELLEAAITCVKSGFALILTGPTSSGKTSFLRYLAYIFGAPLKEFAMNSDIDSTDLLGGYDQVERGQQLAVIWAALEDYVFSNLEELNGPSLGLLEAIKVHDLELAYSLVESDDIKSMIDTYKITDFSKPQFRWFDGALVRAVESGHWLVLDNANLCNPSVLDRLNSLLEPNGVLYINEAPDELGEPRKVVPHPNFRLFFTVDPKYGELSRAMRNRGIEYFVESLADRATDYDRNILNLNRNLTDDSALEPQIETLALSEPEPILSKLPLWCSNLVSTATFADLSFVEKFSWVVLGFLSLDNLRYVGKLKELPPPVSTMFDHLRFYSSLASFQKLLPKDCSVLTAMEPLSPLSGAKLWEFYSFVVTQNLQRRLDTAISNSRVLAERQMSLMETSILSRTKDSINCVDVYSFFSMALKLDWTHHPQALDNLKLFADLLFEPGRDTTKIPVYKDLLSSSKVPELESALHYLNIYYDFTKGGAGLEKTWKEYSGGFPTEKSWEAHERLKQQVRKFDEIASKCAIRDMSEVGQIREKLCELLDDVSRGGNINSGLTDLLETAVEHFPSQNRKHHFQELFVSLQSLLRLSYWSGHSDRFALKATTDLEFFANNNSIELATNYRPRKSIISPYIAPNIQLVDDTFGVLRNLDNVPVSEFSFAIDEIDYFAKVLGTNSNLLSLPIVDGLRDLLLGFIDSMAHIESFEDVKRCLELEATPTNVSKAWLLYGSHMLRVLFPNSPFDPAIRQHVLYDNYCTMKRQYKDDVHMWRVARSYFVSSKTLCGVDDLLEKRYSSLEIQQAPNIYRPKISKVQEIYGEINSVIGMLKPEFYSNMSQEQTNLWNANIDKVLSRLNTYSEYHDLTELFESFLLAFKYGVNLRVQPSSSAFDWLLDPTQTCLDPQKFLERSRETIDSSKDTAVILCILRFSTLHEYDIVSPVVLQGLDYFYQQWTAKRLSLEEQARIEAQSYQQADEEVQSEEEFYKLFPNYDGEVPELQPSEDFEWSVTEIFTSFFKSTQVRAVMLSSLELLESITFDTTNHYSSLATLYLAATEKTRSLGDRDGSHFNFYKESNYVEVLKAVKICQNVQTQIRSFLEKWPEHDTLLTLINACDELLSFSISMPLARYLAKLEQIHHFLDEWQKFASKQNSVWDLINEVTTLIVEWRRLELRTWPSLFEFEKTNAMKATAKYFFHLYEVLIYHPCTYKEADTAEITKALIMFLSGSSYGDFSVRLSLLEVFSQHAERLGAFDVHNALSNVLGFYTQYSSNIEGIIRDKERSLKKEIEEVILLASWRDVNILALKQSAQRSHRALYKVVRKYRGFINQPISSILSQEPPVPMSCNFSNTKFVGSSASAQFVEFLKSTNVWKERPRHLHDIESKALKMKEICLSTESCDMPDLWDLARSTIDEAESLRQRTPSVFTKETKKEISGLKTEKNLLLTTVLKSLKDAGLAPSVKSNVYESQMLLSSVLAVTPYVDHSEYFYRIVEMLPRLRASVMGAETDVSASDLRRGLAFAENMFSILLRQRKVHAKAFKGDLLSSREMLSCLSALYDQSDVYIQIHPGTPSENLSSMLNFISVLSDSDLGRFNADLERTSKPTIYTHDWAGRMSKLYESIKEHLISRKDLGPASGTARELAEHLRAPHSVAQEKVSLETISSVVSDICNSVMVVFQGSVSHLDELNELKELNWLTNSSKTLEALALGLHNSKLQQKVEKLLHQLPGVSKSDSNTAYALVGSMIPFIDAYLQLMSCVRMKFETNLLNNTKSTFEFMKLLHALSTKGFCSPPPPNDEEVDTSKMHDGTGIGDGEGAQSNNADPEDHQDDIEDIAQTANKDQKEKEEQEEDNEDTAIEMEGDMAGELEDAEDQDEDDAEEKSDNNDEIDDEVGDIDDLDPNAVDEKMWNEEAKDNKEKETDKNVNGEDDGMEAKEDEEPNEKPNDDSNEQKDDEAKSEDEGSDVGEQEDDVQTHQDGEELEQNAEEQDALELPENMELDAEDGKGDEDEDMDKSMDDDTGDSNDEADHDREEEATNEVGDDEDGPENPDLEGIRDEVDEEAAENSSNESEHGDEAEPDDTELDSTLKQETDEEELKKEESGDQPAEDAMDVDTAGLHAPQETEEVDKQQSTNTEETSEVSGQGAQKETNQEQDAMDTGEQSSAAIDKENKSDEHENEHQKETSEALKQLGDALKEFYNRQKEIKEKPTANEQEEHAQQDSNINPEELEHVGDAEEFNTQALGKVTEDMERQDIDDSMAIDEDEEPKDEDSDTHMPEKEQAGGEQSTGQNEQSTGAAENERVDEESQIVVPGKTSRDDVDMEDVSDSSAPLVEETEHGKSRSLEEARELWREYDAKTHDLSLILCEQLRLILEPTLATKLCGDYKSGKRLNMKRIIPFIASQFKKDKIWLRRTKPSKREYQVLISIDDSKSMGEPVVRDLAFQAIALVSNALTQVEAGQLAIARFGENTQIVHGFDQPFNASAGANVMQWFGFDQDRTNVVHLLEKSLQVFEDSERFHGASEKWKLEIILSDGICEDHEKVRKLVREAHEKNVMVVFVVLDALNKEGSILDMNQVNYVTDENGTMKLEVDRYMDKFPFEYYVIVRNIRDLPLVMASVLRQYFQAVE